MIKIGDILSYGRYKDDDFSSGKFINEGSFKVIKELGGGGQGDAFLVSIKNEEKVFKCFGDRIDDELRRSMFMGISQNIHRGSPHKAFAWPEYLVEEKGRPIGYIMRKAPQKRDFSYFLDPSILIAREGNGADSKRLASIKNEANSIRNCPLRVRIKIALTLCEAFSALHKHDGLCYQDLNQGNILIDYSTGELTIIDCDNVTGSGHNISHMIGAEKWRAPEVERLNHDNSAYRRSGLPDKRSDYHSLAVILFQLFFRGHPLFDGKKQRDPMETDDPYGVGEDAIFILDPKDRSNPPSDPAVERNWKLFPLYFREAFQKAFSKEALLSAYPGKPHKLLEFDSSLQGKPLKIGRDKRLDENAWMKVLTRLEADLMECSKCASEYFYDLDRKAFRCPSCRSYNQEYSLDIVSPLSAIARIPLHSKSKIHRCQLANSNSHPLEEVFSFKWKGEKLYIKNVSESDVKITYPTRSKMTDRILKNGEEEALKDEMNIVLPNELGGGVIRIVRPG